MEKTTKKQNLQKLYETISNKDVENKDIILNFIEKQIELIDNRAEKAKERAIIKKEQNDELKDAIQAVLTSEPQTLETILSNIKTDNEVTRAKIVSRLTQLINSGIATKEDITTEDGKKVKAYKLV